MLQLKYLFENFQLAKECLELYDHSERNLDGMLQHFRISSNAIYPFFADDEGRVCFLRMAPAEEKQLSDVESEIRFISWLLENGFDAMKPYAMKNGKLCDTVVTKWGTWQVSCFECVHGETLEDAEGSLELAFGYGKTLGEMHNLSERYPFSEERRSHLELLNEIGERLKKHHAPETVLTEFDAVCKEVSVLESNQTNYGLIHYDFEPDNVLFDEKTGSIGVIDFDDSLRCWYALDVVRAIDAMDDVVCEEQTREAVQAFIIGYRSVRDFSGSQADSMMLMRRLVSLQEYATILNVLSEPPMEKPDRMLQIEEKLNNKLKAIEASVVKPEQ